MHKKNILVMLMAGFSFVFFPLFNNCGRDATTSSIAGSMGLAEQQIGTTLVGDDMYIFDENQTGLDGKAKLATAPRWPNGEVRMWIHSEFTSAERTTIIAACNAWAKWANLKCIVSAGWQSSEPTPIVYIFRETGRCSSTYGFKTTTNVAYINLDPARCFTAPNGGIIQHEFGHLLGLIHEHARPDRNSYIRVEFNNVRTESIAAFDIYSAIEITRSGPYDYYSIMHYTKNSGSKPGLQTIFTPSGQYDDIIGTAVTVRGALSSEDKRYVYQMYGPKPYQIAGAAPTGQRNIRKFQNPASKFYLFLPDGAATPVLYVAETISFRAYNQALPQNSTALFNCQINTTKNTRIATGCNSTTETASLIGYASTVATLFATKPLYRCWNPTTNRFMASIYVTACTDLGYTTRNTIAYVP